jgi:hypothetical protein
MFINAIDLTFFGSTGGLLGRLTGGRPGQHHNSGYMGGGGYPGQQHQPQVVYVEQQHASKGSGMGKLALAGS